MNPAKDILGPNKGYEYRIGSFPSHLLSVHKRILVGCMTILVQISVLVRRILKRVSSFLAVQVPGPRIRNSSREYYSVKSCSSELSFPQDNESTCCSYNSDESDDDVLEAVSLLFQQEEEEEDDGTEEYTGRDCGTLIARIIPKDRTGFEEKKPLRCRRSDAHLFRQLLGAAGNFPASPEPIAASKPCTEDDMSQYMVALEVQLTVVSPETISRLPKGPTKCAMSSKAGDGEVSIQMKLLRDAKEPARRTLHRLHLSIAKRLGGRDINAGQAYIRRKGRRDPYVYQPHHHPANVEHIERLSTEPSVWVREYSSTEADGTEDNNENNCLGERKQQQWQSSSQRQFLLTEESPAAATASDEMSSACLWDQLAEFDGSRLYFGIQDKGPLLPLDVDACPPTILDIEAFDDFQSRVYIGVPLAVRPILLHATHAVVAWFIEDEQGCRDCVCSSVVPGSDSTTTYTPLPKDIGKSVTVFVAPLKPGHEGKGYEEAYKYHYPVKELPPMPLVSPLRDDWRRDSHTGDNLRVMSYNLLADWYAGRNVEAARTVGKDKPSKHTQQFYAHCEVDYLLKNRRFPMLVSEILAYHPDLVCLQEVDESVFERLLLPVLRSKGYQGYYSNKASVQREGCAMFWSLEVFEMAAGGDMNEFHLCNILQQIDEAGTHRVHPDKQEEKSWEESMNAVKRLFRTNQRLQDVMTRKVGQVVQVAALKPRRSDGEVPKKPDVVVVGNTHLFYHPMADHVRVIQSLQVCEKLDTIRKESCKGGDAPLVFCGDLNSHPLSGAVELLLHGSIGQDHFEAWRNLNEYNWEMGGEEYLLEHGYIGNDDDDVEPVMDEPFEDTREDFFQDALESIAGTDGKRLASPEASSGLHICFPSTFPGLTSGYTRMPEFTNFSVGFAETLDYIFASEPSCTTEFGFSAVKAAPLPTNEDMLDYAAMPNEFMPSDHVSLVADLGWIRRNEP